MAPTSKESQEIASGMETHDAPRIDRPKARPSASWKWTKISYFPPWRSETSSLAGSLSLSLSLSSHSSRRVIC